MSPYFLVALATPDGWLGRVALATAPFVWIGVKEMLRRRYYQPFGYVKEIRTASEERWHLGLTLFTAAVSVGVLGFVVWRATTDTPGGSLPELLGYMVLVGAMPWLVWRFMSTPLEYVVGVFLVAQAAVLLGGSHYALWAQPHVPLAAVALVVVGIRQHGEFRRLRARLERVSSP